MNVLLRERRFTNTLVVDETLYVSKSRYAVPCAVTIHFLTRAFLPYTEVISIAEEDLQATERYLIEYEIKPSDAIHGFSRSASRPSIPETLVSLRAEPRETEPRILQALARAISSPPESGFARSHRASQGRLNTHMCAGSHRGLSGA